MVDWVVSNDTGSPPGTGEEVALLEGTTVITLSSEEDDDSGDLGVLIREAMNSWMRCGRDRLPATSTGGGGISAP